MNIKDNIKAVEQAGTKIQKEKVMEALRKSNEREFVFSKDTTTGYALIKIKL
jgi:hypothetical protein